MKRRIPDFSTEQFKAIRDTLRARIHRQRLARGRSGCECTVTPLRLQTDHALKRAQSRR